MSPMCVVLLAALAVVAAAPQKYTTKYDNVDLTRILSNERLLNSYYKCLLDQGPCTPDGGELKKNVRDALETGCQKCSAKQREGSETVFRYLLKNRPKEFAELEKKYDPKKVYRAKYQAEAQKRGLKL